MTITSFALLVISSSLLYGTSGKEVFESYCWGCHHQTATAFGPSFASIASKRSAEEIEAMITDPKAVSIHFGYKRNAMPKLPLTKEELDAITAYILSFKAPQKEQNQTIRNTVAPDKTTSQEHP